MSKLRLILDILIVLLIVGLAISFIIANQFTVDVDLLFTGYQLDLGIALIASLLIGCVIGYVFRLPSALMGKKKPVQKKSEKPDVQNTLPANT